MRRKRKKQLAEALAHARGNGGDTRDGGLALYDQSSDLLQVLRPGLTEGIRRLVARLEATEKGAIPGVLGVTSALSGEGVTFVSRGLGAVIANDMGRSIVVVELNWARPVSPTSGIGIAQVLTGEATLKEALRPTVIDGFDLLSAGVSSVAQRPVLARSAALVQVINELQSLYEHVVLDLPAVLATSDALTLAGRAEAVALVVRQGITGEPQVKRALSELDHIALLGVIINQWSSPIPKRLLAGLSPWIDAANGG